ncbi:acyl-CoA dehydrogenase family protein [Micromonospora sp. WMMD736]|uniref:acyl-CoA dehydrogenase family protein n=1 Tax=Micromonospora sp. WMMD736 TaxID=3404112 RepID=UPI003B954DD7
MALDFEPDPQLVATTAHLLGACTPAELPATLMDSGWLEMWAEDPQSAGRALFGQQGRLASASPMLSKLLGAALAESDGLAEAVLLPTFSEGARDFAQSDGRSLRCLAQYDAIAGQDYASVGVRVDGQSYIVRVGLPTEGLKPARGLDPDGHWCLVEIPDPLGQGEILAVGGDADTRWLDVVALGRRLLAEEMIGLVAAQLDMAVEHAKSRAQFGRFIGSFQAVKHKLAETYVVLEIARLAVVEAWSDSSPIASTMAKVHAGAAVETANRHCQQVLGGIGFTWEHEFHRYYRRGRVLDAVLGSTADLTGIVGQRINVSGAVPSTVQLR